MASVEAYPSFSFVSVYTGKIPLTNNGGSLISTKDCKNQYPKKQIKQSKSVLIQLGLIVLRVSNKTSLNFNAFH